MPARVRCVSLVFAITHSGDLHVRVCGAIESYRKPAGSLCCRELPEDKGRANRKEDNGLQPQF